MRVVVALCALCACASASLQLVRLGSSDLRADFPILHQKVWDGRQLVYLDSAATSQKPKVVLEAMARHQEADNANVHRGAHLLSVRSTEAYEGARDKIATFVNAARREEIVFSRGATEAINLVAQSWGGSNLREGDEVVITVAEHHSNIVPWQMLAETRGVKVKWAKLTEDETVDVEHLKSLISERTKLVAVAHASNVLGYVNPVAEIVAAAKKVGALVLLDACQSLPHMPVDVQALGADFLVGSGHKMCGPTGIGFLWARYDLLEAMPPWQGGGEMIRDVTLEGSTYMPPPSRFEAGTPAITQAVGLGAAVDYLSELGMGAIEEYEQTMGKLLYEALDGVGGLRLYGPAPGAAARTGLCAFNSQAVHASDLATFLDQDGVAIRAGHHCAQPLHRELGAAGSARASLYFYNTEQELDVLVDAIKGTVDMFATLDES